MALKTLAINYTIPVGTYLKLGYRVVGSGTVFTYVNPSPFFNETPYSIALDDTHSYEFELSTICGDGCDGASSTPIYIQEGL